MIVLQITDLVHLLMMFEILDRKKKDQCLMKRKQRGCIKKNIMTRTIVIFHSEQFNSYEEYNTNNHIHHSRMNQENENQRISLFTPREERVNYETTIRFTSPQKNRNYYENEQSYHKENRQVEKNEWTKNLGYDSNNNSYEMSNDQERIGNRERGRGRGMGRERIIERENENEWQRGRGRGRGFFN
ncbi:hypothetical protein M0812_05348 [Anaeramoeba flamelloides]|uniref:Uncharacterized protein n=1 Tax=Anaeramoeba flamelloides TaxID=1746091 RepID=A0AAV8A606_9EUKA|nr:hypothetical protein M0812_05348 [Anaeramoeba flamelloides]